MARYEPDPNVTLSVLDRLIDNDPSSPVDPPAGRAHSLRQLKAALRRDLEWLLNTRRTPDAIQDAALQLYKSLYNYGLPDISNLSMLSIADQNRLLRMMENTLALFEPRLKSTRVLLESAGAGSRILRFLIEGLLRLDPAPERVSFDTLLELTSREYEVKGE
jgi:type VI secretion system protein ImpF